MTDEMTLAGNRRKHERTAITRPAKVYHAGSARYLPAYTRDLSAGGALLEIDTPREIRVDDSIEVLVAWHDRTLLSAAEQVRARVTRVLRTDTPRQYVAVEFAMPQVVAARRAA